jgi:predicted ATPase/DNA-binding CsgD family transcriptional regulator
MSTVLQQSEISSNLPLQLTSFVGREREAAEVRRLLSTARLLTLTGAGGCGKTRLALHVAAGLAGSGPEIRFYPDGVWLVELAALGDPALVAQAVASTLGVREVPSRSVLDGLVDALRGKAALIVLDNCEHLVAAVAPVMDALLQRCPNLRILATSREALGSVGETTWRVPSLAVPPVSAPGERSVDGLARYEAVQLFVDRARSMQPGFEVTDENAAAVAEICRRLDGIPLAIELAAARVKIFAVQQIVARLDDQFRLLGGGRRTAMPRHQTLGAMVDWSHDLLSEPERVLLRRLSVFAGGWSFEAAESVASGDGIQVHAVLDLLAQLVDKSLVIAEEERGAVRYRMLETIRQYAEAKVRESGETERTRNHHGQYFLALAEAAEPNLRGAEQRTWMLRLDVEYDNLRAALEWALTVDGAAALRLCGALAWYWWMRASFEEGRRWPARALAATQGRTAARMKALHGAGWLAHHQRDSASAQTMLDESLSIARTLSDRWTESWVLQAQGRIAYFENDPVRTLALGSESLAIAEALEDRSLIAWALHLLGLAAFIAGDYPTARAHYERSLAIRREFGYEEGIGILLVLLGILAFREGDYRLARTQYQEGLSIMRRLGVGWHLSMILACFSGLAAAQGQPDRAVRLAGAAVAWSETYHALTLPFAEQIMAEALAAAGQALDEASYTAALAAGRAMSLDEGIAEAFAVEVDASAASPARGPSSRVDGPFRVLTATEVEVLRLLAGGRTTKEIAGELVVAVSTVDRHITHIYGKLGVRNRAEATALALTQRLV